MKPSFSKEKYEEQTRREAGQLLDIRINKKGSYILTPVTTPVRTYTVYYPSVVTNPDTQEQRLITMNIPVPDRRVRADLLKELEDMEVAFLFEKGIEKPRSRLAANVVDVTYCIPKVIPEAYTFDDYKKQPICLPAYFKPSITAQMFSIVEKISPIDKTVLQHGPAYSVDFQIERTIADQPGPEYQRIRYLASVFNAPLANKVPLETYHNGISEEYPPEKVLSKEELIQIELLDDSLMEKLTPLNNEEIMARLQEFPINISGRSMFATPSPFFADKQLVGSFCEENGIPYVDIEELTSTTESENTPIKKGAKRKLPDQKVERL